MIVQDTRDIHTHVNCVNGTLTVTETHTLRRIVTLTDNDIWMPHEMNEKYGHRAKFMPSRVVLVYVEKTDWRTDEKKMDLDWAYVQGNNIKKDGSAGARNVENKYYRLDRDLPEWVSPLIDQFDPNSAGHPFSAPAEFERAAL